MTVSKTRVLAACLAVGFALTGSGCGTPSYINTENLGPLLEGKEAIIRTFSGHYLDNAHGGGSYFAPDGAAYFVETSINQIGFGRWFVSDDGRRLCIVDQTGAYVENGKVTHFKAPNMCGWFHPQPDGTFLVDQMGGGSETTGKLTKG